MDSSDQRVDPVACLAAAAPAGLTRHPLVRRGYDWLAARGVTGALLDRYELAEPGGEADPPTDVGLERTTGDGTPESLATVEDAAVVAQDDTRQLGHVIVSDRPVPVPPLGGRVPPRGGYVWGLAVTPAARGRGIGTALVGAAVDLLVSSGDGSRAPPDPPAWALIAPDNAPSRIVFERNGFVPTDRTGYARLGPFDARVGAAVTVDRS